MDYGCGCDDAMFMKDVGETMCLVGQRVVAVVVADNSAVCYRCLCWDMALDHH